MQSFDEPTTLYPKRFRWLIRLSVLFVIVIASLIGIRLWWGHIAHTRLEAEVARIQAAGEPLHRRDIEPQPVPDDDNAAYHLNQALLVFNGIRPAEDQYNPYITEADEDPDDSIPELTDEEYFARADEALTLIRRARECSRVDWSVQLASPMLASLTPQLTSMRTLARDLEGLAQRYAQRGEPGEAMRIVPDVFAIGDLVAQSQPMFLIDHLVGIAIRRIGIAIVQRDIADFLVTEGNERLPDALTRDEIKALINCLLDETNARASARNGLIGERASTYEIGVMLASGELGLPSISRGVPTFGDKATGVVVGPMFRLDTAAMMRFYEVMIEASQMSDHFTAEAYVEDNIPTYVDTPEIVNVLSSLIMPATGSVRMAEFRNLTHRRLAATALAIRLYEADHGRIPDTLEALVPNYLNELPIDPMTNDRRPLSYKPEGVRPMLPEWARSRTEAMDGRLERPIPILYSVGEDGMDNLGEFVLDDAGEYDRRESPDLVFLLDGPVTDLPDPPAIDDTPPPYLYEGEDDPSQLEAGVDDPEPADRGGDADQNDRAEQRP